MEPLPADVVGDAYTSAHPWELLSDLVDIDSRMAGQRGEAEGAERVREAFESHGLREVEMTEFEIPGWWRGESSLTVERDRTYSFDEQYQLIALPGTPAATVEADLVDVGHGLPEDFEAADLEGNIAMASSFTPEDYGRWIHRSDKYESAVEAGAAAFVFRRHVEGCLPPTGSIGDDDGPGPIPAVGVSKEVGDRLVRYCEDADGATLSVECRNERATSQNVEAVVGPDTDQEVVVVAHVDGHDIADGARDNGVGTVLVSEVGRLLARVEDDLETRVLLLVVGAEEVGLFGSKHWASTHDLDQVKCVVNADGVGYSRNIAVYTHEFDAIGEAFADAGDDLRIPVETNSQIRPNSDHWPFVKRGVPGVQIRSATAGSSPGWVHSHADTLDKIDERDVRALAVGIAAGVRELTDSDRTFQHKSASEIREVMEAAGFEEDRLPSVDED